VVNGYKLQDVRAYNTSIQLEFEIMSEIEDLGVTVEEYLEGMAAGIDILELKRLEKRGIPTNLALEVMDITAKVINGTATDEV
jgi:hypothetical protein